MNETRYFYLKPKFRSTVLVAAVLSLTVAAFALRLAYVNTTVIQNPIRADAREYVIYAHNMVEHGTFSKEFPSDDPQPDSYRSPGYPAIIAMAMLAGGKSGFYRLALYAQVLISALIVPLTFLVSRRFVPRPAAIAVTALVALSPHMVTSTGYLLTETLFSFVFLASLAVFLLALEKNKICLFAVSGALFGYAYLVNTTVFFVPWLLSAFVMAKILKRKAGHTRTRRADITKVGLFLAVFSVFWGGWAVRNAVSVAPEGKSGLNRALSTMTHGSYPGFVYKDPRYKYFPYREDPRQPEYARSLSSFVNIFWERFSERPLRYLVWYFIEKPYYLWSWDILQGQGDVYIYPVSRSLYTESAAADASHAVMKRLHPFIAILALAGVVIGLGHRRKMFESTSSWPFVLIIVPLLYFTVLYGFFFAPWPRYAVPLRPQFYLCAVWAALIIFKSFTPERNHKEPRLEDGNP